jgi:hypothetical protein
MKFTRLLLISFLFFLIFQDIFAISITVESPTGILPQHSGWSDSGTTIANIISYAISLTAVLAVMAVTWWAIQMILASGEEEKVKKSRMIIIYAFVWLLIAGLAYGIVKMITNLQL